MSATLGFLVSLAITLALLTADVITGRKALRRKHLTLVACTFVGLGLTIYYAEQLGKEYDLESAGSIYPVHIAFAKLTVLAYLLPVITGIMTIRGRCKRTTHGGVAGAVILLTLITAVTGTWMILASNPI
jgi:hypothetical protein